MKVCWIDIETGGLEPQVHGIHEVSVIIEIDYKVMEENKFYCYERSLKYDDLALKHSGRTKIQLEQGKTYLPEYDLKKNLDNFLGKYVNKFDKKDKYIPGGYNVQFDLTFLETMWKRQGDNYFWSYFYHEPIDPAAFYSMMEYFKLVDRSSGKKLVSVAESLGVDLGLHAHDSEFDIQATRAIVRKMGKYIHLGKKLESQINGQNNGTNESDQCSSSISSSE